MYYLLHIKLRHILIVFSAWLLLSCAPQQEHTPVFNALMIQSAQAFKDSLLSIDYSPQNSLGPDSINFKSTKEILNANQIDRYILEFFNKIVIVPFENDTFYVFEDYSYNRFELDRIKNQYVADQLRLNANLPPQITDLLTYNFTTFTLKSQGIPDNLFASSESPDLSILSIRYKENGKLRNKDNLWVEGDTIIDYCIVHNKIKDIVEAPDEFQSLVQAAIEEWELVMEGMVVFNRRKDLEDRMSAVSELDPFAIARAHNVNLLILGNTKKFTSIPDCANGKSGKKSPQSQASGMESKATLATASIGPGADGEVRDITIFPAFGKDKKFNKQGIIRHELGHILGLVHTCHDEGVIEKLRCPQEIFGPNVNDIRKNRTETYDFNSVMKSLSEACEYGDTNFAITAEDAARIRNFYRVHYN